MSVKHGILGILADGPRHGYELKTQFDGLTGGQEALAWLATGGTRSGSERARWSRECARMRREVMAGAA